MARLINLRYKCKGFNFDAAIDINDTLHSYFNFNKRKYNIPIELYNIDKPDWDTKLICLNKENFIENPDNTKDVINEPDSIFCHSVVSFSFIYNETIKWINEVLGLNYELEK